MRVWGSSIQYTVLLSFGVWIKVGNNDFYKLNYVFASLIIAHLMPTFFLALHLFATSSREKYLRFNSYIFHSLDK